MTKIIRKGAMCSVLTAGAVTAATTVFASSLVAVASGVIVGAISNTLYLKVEEKF